MKEYKYIIVGAGVAGTTAAFSLRKLDDAASILLIGKESENLYNRIMLPHYLKGTTPFERIFLKNDEDYKNGKIDYMKGEIVTEVNPDEKTLALRSGANVGYDKLLLATGAAPNKLDLDVDRDKLFYLYDLNDTNRINQALTKATNGLVVGGSFIALELIAVLLSKNMKTSVLLKFGQFFPGLFDQTADRILSKYLEDKGLNIIRNKDASEIVLSEYDFIGVGIGVTRNTNYLNSSGVQINKGVVVNEFLESNIKNIYAAGDAAEFFHPIHNEHILLGNWTNAQNQGKAAAQNMAGGKLAYDLISNYSTSTIGINISTFGETNESKADLIKTSGGIGDMSYSQIYIKGGVIVGALLINRVHELAKFSKAIKEKTPADSLE